MLGLAASGCDSGSPPARPANLFNAQALRSALEEGAAPSEQADTGGAEQLGEPTGWATIRGVFKLRGAAPARSTLDVNRDQEVCAGGGHQILDERLVVGPNGGIRDVLVFLTSPIPDDSAAPQPKFVHPSYNLANNPQRQQVVFDQKQCVFLSHVFAAQVGQTILIKNSDPIGHNTNLSARTGKAFNQTIPAGGSESYVAEKAERDPFPVSCSIHPWMSAQIIIRDNPYFAVTNEEGEFEIANVPAGVPLEFRVWQERLKNVTKVTYTGADGASSEQTWKKGLMTVTLDADSPLSFQAEIDASLIK